MPDPNPLEDVEMPDFLSEFKPAEPQQMPDPRRQMPEESRVMSLLAEVVPAVAHYLRELRVDETACADT